MPHIFTAEERQRSVISKQDTVMKDLQSDKPSYRSNYYIKKLIKDFNLLPHQCLGCGINKWKEQELILELDHIDGDAANNKLHNLRLLCPNCHSLTPTYRGKSKNTGKLKVSDTELIKAIKETDNIRQALIRVGLTPRGGNYTRATKLKLLQ